jgi:YD repeat-containing protein
VEAYFDLEKPRLCATDSQGRTLWSGTVHYGISAFTVAATDLSLDPWQYTFDALGEMTAWTDAESQPFSASYDALSRPITRTEPDFFTQWTWGTSAASQNIGKLQSVCTGTGRPTQSTRRAYENTGSNRGSLFQQLKVAKCCAAADINY